MVQRVCRGHGGRRIVSRRRAALQREESYRRAAGLYICRLPVAPTPPLILLSVAVAAAATAAATAVSCGRFCCALRPSPSRARRSLCRWVAAAPAIELDFDGELLELTLRFMVSFAVRCHDMQAPCPQCPLYKKFAMSMSVRREASAQLLPRCTDTARSRCAGPVDRRVAATPHGPPRPTSSRRHRLAHPKTYARHLRRRLRVLPGPTTLPSLRTPRGVPTTATMRATMR